MAQPQEFPFNIMDVAELLHLHIRRRQADSVYADCPICGNRSERNLLRYRPTLSLWWYSSLNRKWFTMKKPYLTRHRWKSLWNSLRRPLRSLW